MKIAPGIHSPPITCFPGMATFGPAASRKRSGRYVSGTTAAANSTAWTNEVRMSQNDLVGTAETPGPASLAAVHDGG